MKSKRKTAIALLSAVCAASAIFGLAACSGGGDGGDGKNDPPEGTPDAGMVAVYEAYKEVAGSTALTYESWLTSVKGDGDRLSGSGAPDADEGDDGSVYIDLTSWDIYVKSDGAWTVRGNGYGSTEKGVASLTVNGDDVLEVAYADGSTQMLLKYTSSDVEIAAFYTVKAENQYGEPVADVYFTLYYTVDNYEAVNISDSFTNAAGIASFNLFAEESLEYSIKISDPNDHPFPAGYTSTNGGFENETFGRSGSTSAKAGETPIFLIVSTANSIIDNIGDIGYRRYYNLTTGVSTETAVSQGVKETGAIYTAQLTGGYYKFLQFAPMVAASPADSNESVSPERVQLSLAAASGTYKFTVTGGGITSDAVLYYYSGTYSAIMNNSSLRDENGVPAIILAATGNPPADAADGSVYTGSNSITINFDSYIAGGDAVFGIFCEESCSVTIFIERIADATEVETEEITLHASVTEKYDEVTDSLVLMPVDGSISVYLADDGYYRVGSEDGPYLLAQLKNIVSRFNTAYPVSYYDPSTLGFSKIYSVTDSDGRILKRYYYSTFIDEYLELTNDSGVYPVNEELKVFLELFGTLSSVAADGYAWMLPCYYNEPAEGLAVSGSGTLSSPYVLHEGKNTVTVSGTAYINFSPTTEGIYTFAISGGNCSFVCTSDAQTSLVNNVLYVAYTGGGQLRSYTLTGNGTYTVSITGGYRTAMPVNNAGSDSVASEYVGISEETAVPITGTVPVFITLDPNASEEGIYIRFRIALGGEGTYVLDIGNTTSDGYFGGYIIYQGQAYKGTELTLDAEVGKDYYLLICNRYSDGKGYSVDGSVMLNIYKKSTLSATDTDAEITAGGDSTTVTLPPAGGSCAVTVTNGLFGVYRLTISSYDTAYRYGTYTVVINGNTYTLSAEAGFFTSIPLSAGQALMTITSDLLSEVEVTISLVPSDEPTNDTALQFGYNEIYLDSKYSNIEYYFTATATGTYVFKIEEGSTLSISYGGKEIVGTNSWFSSDGNGYYISTPVEIIVGDTVNIQIMGAAIGYYSILVEEADAEQTYSLTLGEELALINIKGCTATIEITDDGYYRIANNYTPGSNLVGITVKIGDVEVDLNVIDQYEDVYLAAGTYEITVTLSSRSFLNLIISEADGQ